MDTTASASMADIHFRLMELAFRVVDIFRNPRKRFADIPIDEGMKVVDYGCGPGRYTLMAADTVGASGMVYAVDIHPMAVSRVRKKCTAGGMDNVVPVLVEGYDTGIGSHSIDLVYLLDAFFMIPDKRALLAEIRRILKPTGRLFMDPGHMNADTAQDIVMKTGMFDSIERRGRDFLLSPRP